VEFFNDEVAVSAEKVDKNARWHIKCFTCKVCNKLLSDLLYFHWNKEIYCKKHYNELNKTKMVCAACDMEIKSNEYVCAENQVWHLNHFVCWHCNKSLGGQNYLLNKSKPYCIDCYEENFTKVTKYKQKN
jgi:prickle